MIKSISKTFIIAPLIILALFAHGAGITMRNPPSECTAPANKCGCPEKKVTAKCIKATVDLGETTPWTGSLECALKIFADNTSPSIFTAHSLYAVLGGYTFKRLGMLNLNDGITPAEVVLSHPNGEPVHFVFKEGESIARPDPGVHIKMDERLMMVDAQGWATTKEPVYYDLYVGDGSRRRFLATNMTGALGELVSITTPRGVTMTPADMGIDIVYDSNGVRQFLTPSRLANITHTDGWTGYDVTVYALRSTPQKDAQTGLYVLPTMQPIEVFSVRRENEERRAIVTVQKGGGDTLRYVFDYAMGDWSLTRPSGAQELRERYMADEYAARIVTSYVSSKGERLERTEYNYKWESWGFAVTNKIEGFGGITDTTSWTYYISGNGKGQVKTEKRQSGLLIEYAYDSADRVISEKRSGPDMMTEIMTYAYAPVDPSDPALPVDTRPRTIVKTLNGIECERTYYVYAPFTNIVERVGAKGAPYGGTNVLRTVTAFYPIVANDLRSGLVSSVRHEDGKLDIYDYSLNDGIWTEMVTHVHEQSPEPVSGKTTRDITETNARGETIETRTEAYIEGAWHVIARERMTYNAEGKRIATENLAGQVTTTAWDCCHKISEVQPDGSTTMWDYDDEGRMIASSRLIPLDMTNVTWLTTCYEYDDLGRQIATWQTNRAAKVGLPATRTHYEALGRVVARVDQLGNTTMMSYSNDGRTVSVQNPNTSTRVITRSADGDTLSITGSAVTPEFHTYDILPDGTRWYKTVQGETASSPRFTKRYENLLGQTIRSEESGFGGAVVVTSYCYDDYGRCVSQASEGVPTLRQEYNAYGEASASVIQSGEVEWRRSDFSSCYELRGTSVWWMAEAVGSCSDENIADRRQAEAKRISGVSRMLLAESQKIDLRGNISTSRTEYSSSSGTVQIDMTPGKSLPDTALYRFGVLVCSGSGTSGNSFAVYDGLGRRCATISGSGNVSRREYDKYGRLFAEIDADGNRTAYGYDVFGRLESLTNALGEVRRFEYDIRGRKVFDGGSMHSTRYAYDVFGNTVSMINYRDGQDAAGDETRWVYDVASGKLASKIFANGKGPGYFYNANGLCTRRVWARGVETTYGYNCWGDLVRTEYSDGTPTVVRMYDVLGRLTNVLDAAGTTTYEYNAVGDLHRVVVDAGEEQNTIEYHHDEYGRSLGYSLDGVRQSTLAYDPASGRLATMEAVGSSTPFVWSYHDGRGFKSALVYPNGLTVAWNYGRRGELMDVDNACITGSVSRFAYGYDAVERRVSCARSGMVFPDEDTYAYFYNSRGELTNAVATLDSDYQFEYEFDGAGNRIRASERGVYVEYFADQLNQYTNVVTAADNGFVPTFDDDGNQTLVKTSTGIWSVVYNGENRPIRWTCIQSGSPSITNNQTIVMSYDFLGRRVKKGNRRFVYNGYNQIADNAGNVYVWDPTEPVATRPLVWLRGTSAVYYTHDGNRNVSEVVAANGDIVAHYEYAPFGAVITQQGDLAAANPWRFSSEYADDDMGLVYYIFRHYDPMVGRWLSREEFAVDSQNYYEYLSNAPTTTTEYLGFYDEKVHFYLMYLMMLDLLKNKEKALAFAQGSQYPDSREQFNAIEKTWLFWRNFYPTEDRKKVRELLHNLNGLKCCELKQFQNCIKGLIDDKSNTDNFLKGVYLHVYADTFAHVRAGVKKDDEECSYGYSTGHAHALTFPDDLRWEYFDEKIGEQRLRDFLSGIETIFDKKFSPEFYSFIDKIYQTKVVEQWVRGYNGLPELRTYKIYVYDLDFIEMEAQRKGFPGKYVPDSVFGDSYTKYDNRDKDVANKAMPKLNDCLKKARETAK